MFGLERRFGSPKEEVLKISRTIRSVGMRNRNASVFSSLLEGLGQPNDFNLRAYIATKEHIHETEGQKAMITSLSRMARART